MASWISQGIEFAFLSVLAAMLLWTPALASQNTQSAKSEGAALRGTVHDRSGKLVADAHVVLHGEPTQASRETSTDDAGSFSFAGVNPGTFTVTANSGSLCSAVVSLIVSSHAEQPAIDLILSAPQAPQSGSTSENAGQAMQFADKPDFAIAAVTDTSAAGGHGSDASLRTSEALTKEAVKMGPGSGQAAAVEPSGASLHRMQGELDEKLGDPLSAVHEFQEAASEDATEDNYFAWGSELLIHRAIWQAKEVFDEGVRLYPQSARMLAARGATLFAGAQFNDAALDLCKASDLNPEIVEPYLFIGKIEVAAPNPLPCVVEKLARFEKLQPANSLANYYYAMALQKQGQAADGQTMEQVKNLLTRAVTLDPKNADAYLELGNLSAGQKQWEQAIDYYLKAIQADPELNDAHYRLGVAYVHVGEKAKAQEQFQLHTAIAGKQASELERQRKEVKQFVVVLPDRTGKQQAQ